MAHRIIWETVVGPIPDGMEVNHINGKKDDNRITNLEVVTHKENMRHARRTGLTPYSTFKERGVFGTNIITGDGWFFKSIAEARRYGFHNVIVTCQGLRPHDKGYTWEYA